MKKPQSIFDINHISPADVGKSSAWFEKRVEDVVKKGSALIRPSKLMVPSAGTITTTIIPGRMYLYLYDPKGKDTLPYFDSFPLVLPFNRTRTHFTGLNLHYLDYPLRFMLIKELLRVSSLTTLNERSKMKFTWEMVSSMAKLRPAEACVKQYLISHIRSPLFEVSPTEWHTAALLPFQRFHGNSTKAIWRDSVRKING